MTKAVVNGFDEVFRDYQFTFMVEHSGRRNFQKDWFAALDRVKADNPEEWQVDDIEKELKKLGWKLKNVKTIEVCY